MEVLLEIRGSRRPLKPFTEKAVLDIVKSLDKEAFISLSDSVDDDLGGSPYILQRWSAKWNTYVDVYALNEIQDQDQITVIPKNFKESEVGLFMKYLQPYVTKCVHDESHHTFNVW